MTAWGSQVQVLYRALLLKQSDLLSDFFVNSRQGLEDLERYLCE